MKLANLINEIGFRDKASKSVEDVTADKFEDFGITVGQLYQTFLKKDLKSKPAIAQKIMNMVDTDDNNALINQIKDLEFLVNQLPDKIESKDKIGFKEEFHGKPFMQDTPNEFAYLDFKKWAYPRRGKIKQRLQAILDSNQADPGVPFFKELTRIWVIWANENDKAFSVVNPTDVGQKDFGRALAVMMKNDNLIINKESNKLLDLNERPLTSKEKQDKEKIVKGLKGKKGLDKSAKYAIATAQAKKMEEMTNDEFEKAKEADRLEKHPEKDKIKKVQQLIRKQIKELWPKK